MSNSTYLLASPQPLHKLFTMTNCFLWKEELPLKSGRPSASHRCTWNTTKNRSLHAEMQSTDSLSRVWQTGPGYCIKATNVTLDCIPVSSLAGDTCHIPHETVDPLFVFRQNQTALGYQYRKLLQYSLCNLHIFDCDVFILAQRLPFWDYTNGLWLFRFSLEL